MDTIHRQELIRNTLIISFKGLESSVRRWREKATKWELVYCKEKYGVLGDDFEERRESSNEIAFGGRRGDDVKELVFNRAESSFFHSIGEKREFIE